MSTHNNLNLLYRKECFFVFCELLGPPGHERCDPSPPLHPVFCCFLRFAPQPFLRVLFLVPTPAGVQKRNRRKAHLVPGT